MVFDICIFICIYLCMFVFIMTSRKEQIFSIQFIVHVV